MITSWFEDTFPAGYGVAIMWTAAALLALVALLILVRIARAFRSGTFVAGGRNRKPRLAVMDATPIDAKRRLVLVRRDDVEHLILIGGANDLMIEQGITLVERAPRASPQPEMDYANPAHLAPQPQRSAATPGSYSATPRPEPQRTTQRPVTQIRDLTPPAPQTSAAPAPRSSTPAPALAPARPPQPQAARPRTETASLPPAISAPPRQSVEPQRQTYTPPARPAEIAAPPRASSTMTIPSVPISRPVDSPRASGLSAPTIAPIRRPPPVMPANQTNPARPAGGNVDAALMRELEMGLDTDKPEVSAGSEISLDDEMAKLLGELSRDKR